MDDGDDDDAVSVEMFHDLICTEPTRIPTCDPQLSGLWPTTTTTTTLSRIPAPLRSELLSSQLLDVFRIKPNFHSLLLHRLRLAG